MFRAPCAIIRRSKLYYTASGIITPKRDDMMMHCPPLPYCVVPLKPKYLLKTLFPSTLSLGTSLSASDKVSHTYKRTGTIIILYILTFIFWITNGRQNVLDRTVSGIPWVDCALNFFMNAVFISYGCSQIREYCRLSAVFVLWFCTASWTRDINMYLVFSASLLDHCPC